MVPNYVRNLNWRVSARPNINQLQFNNLIQLKSSVYLRLSRSGGLKARDAIFCEQMGGFGRVCCIVPTWILLVLIVNHELNVEGGARRIEINCPH